jgi:PKD repeat protein
LVSPSDGSTVGGTTSASLQVSVSDPDGDPMDISFYNANGDILIGTVSGISSGATASKTWSGLSAGTTYSWYAAAYDGEYSTSSATWSFTTGSGGSPPGPPGPPSPPPPPPSNQPPSADANGPYFEFKDKLLGYAEVTFDGSGSSGTISTYKWDFGDGTTGTGKNPTHKYTSIGNYTVILNVTGPLGYDEDKTYALITLGPNIPPTAPIITGPQTGSKNTDYDYSAVSTDGDNDQLKYTFNWDDTTSITTEFVPNGTTVTESHKWSEAGVYTINVKVSDNQSETSADYVVLIDAIWVKDIGYLLDTDGDGTYDIFYSNETGVTTESEKQEDGTYLINSDDDSGWDWIYDPDTDTLTEYSESAETTEEDNSLWYAVGILLIILILGIILFAGRKKGKKDKKGKKPKK